MGSYATLLWPGSPSGQTRADRQSCRYRSYLPDPLVGRPLSLPAERAADVAEVERRIVAMNASARRSINLEATARLLLRAEAVASSYIEGLQINIRRLAKADFAQRVGLDSSDETARAVLGNINAMEAALELSSAPRISVDDIVHIHERLVADTRLEKFGGRIREQQNWIGGTGFSPCTASFVPPPHEQVPDLLDDLCAYISGDDHPVLVQAALAHAQFETIHPFIDGNGRTGRALIHLILRRRGLAPRFIPPISLVLASHADAYVAALQAYSYEGSAESDSAQGAMGVLIDRFVVDTQRACIDSDRFGATLDALESRWRTRLGRIRAGSSMDLLLRALPATPVLTVATAAELVGRTDQRVGDAVNVLVEAGILKQTTVGRRNRAFEAPEVFGVFTGFERALASPLGDTEQSPPIRPVPYRNSNQG